MIAPLREPGTQKAPESLPLLEAHRLIAQTLLKERDRIVSRGPRVPAWQAWLFAGWVVFSTLVYVFAMLDWW